VDRDNPRAVKNRVVERWLSGRRLCGRKGLAVKSADRLPVLDGLRAISILLVLATHMLPLGPKVLKLNDTAGAMGMSMFFALSGFLITSTLLHNPDVYEFMVKRLARILPLAYAYTFLVFTFVVFDPQAAFWTASFLVNYLTQYMVDGLNNHFWSLCVEIHFYLAIAVVVLILRQKALWIVWPACLAITALRISDGAYIAIQTHLRVDEILAGACVATLYRSSWEGRMRYSTMWVGLASIAWVVSGSPYAAWFQYLRPYTAALVLGCVLCHGQTLLAAVLASRPMRYIATISYALYVVHPLTTHGWLNEGSIVDRYLLKRPISFIATFAAAHISTFYWERYWMQAGRKWIEARRIRLAQSAI
jgi:peptidoglycan/LPS O-acetylase OafA/YrhL